MRDVDDHALGRHRLDRLPPERRQSNLLESVHRPGEVIVEEMGEPRHAEARGVEFVKVGELAFEDVQPFDAEHRADGHRPAAAGGEQGVDILGSIDQTGRASCRERVWQYVSISVGTGSRTKNTKSLNRNTYTEPHITDAQTTRH